MPEIPFTAEQRRAIETVDRHVLVTAAAGSGKTAVLAERCAYLVAEAPPPFRCGIDQLLVVTFTEAAAAEMRSRIVEALDRRLRNSPDDGALQLQLRLVDSARISTLHAFCLWIVRQWFGQAEIDPTATVMDEDETRVLRAHALTELFEELYASDTELGRAFADCVEVYGLGSDEAIGRFVLELDVFLSTLPDSEAWLQHALLTESSVNRALDRHIEALRLELTRQLDSVRRLRDRIRACGSAGEFYRSRIELYEQSLRAWSEAVLAGSLDTFDQVQAQIEAVEFNARGAPRRPKEADAEWERCRDEARDAFEDVRERLWKGRLLRRFGRFTMHELREGSEEVSRYVETVVKLARSFRHRYDRIKQVRATLDYADLERQAYYVLTRSDESAVIRATLQNRFAHVLVDEFQDINPLQAAILDAVSRDPKEGHSGNLFTVGDVKQSIYRFRLAEPTLFLDRQQTLSDEQEANRRSPLPENDAERGVGSVVTLQTNFRSTPHLLRGINAIFRRLMRPDLGGMAYDDSAELRPGVSPIPETPDPIDVHLLERRPDAATDEESDEDDPRFIDPRDPSQWTVIRREAHLIGREILRMRDASSGDGSFRYGDVAVLLRAPTHNAGQVVAELRSMGIPAKSEVSDGALASLEVQDVLALLELLDNARQDIPWAAVLRSGITGDRFSEDDLAEIRAIEDDLPFHDAVAAYCRFGTRGPLRSRLTALQSTLARYRQWIRRRPLPEALWNIYGDTGYLRYVVGLDHGPERRGHLIAFYELAKKFGSFRRQGLHRFLSFLESLEGDSPRSFQFPASDHADDAVRVMSIHKSKGLEFPVVFVADLGRRFNQSDVRGRMIFEREVGIGFNIIDQERRIEYPSLLHVQAVARTLEQSLAEELRVLYVAMTRAKRKLILVGSLPLEQAERRRRQWKEAGDIDSLTLLSAHGPLDWLVPAFASMPGGDIQWDTGSFVQEHPLVAVRFHTDKDIAEWNVGDRQEVTKAKLQPLRQAAAALGPLPRNEPIATDAVEVRDCLRRLDYVYPYLPVTSVRAVMGATEAKRRLDSQNDPDARPSATLIAQRQRASSAARFDPATRGIATHRVLQFLDFNDLADEAALLRQLDRMTSDQQLSSEDGAAVDVNSLLWFARTDLADRIRAAGSAYHREFMFLASEPASAFDPTVPNDGEQVMVRGVVDGVIVGDVLELIDFKTDDVPMTRVTDRATEYAMQICLYSRALERIWRKSLPAENRWLVFLGPRTIINPLVD